MADGTPANPKEVPELVRWTGLKLHVAFERYPFEWAEDRAPRVPAVRALTAAIARAAPWKFMHALGGSSWRGTPSKPKRFSQADLDAYTKKVVLQRFNANVPSPRLLVRVGGELDVQYAWSLDVTDLGLTLFAHDTEKNRRKMEKLWALVRRSHSAAVWATLGHGYAGASSSLLAGIRYPWGPWNAFSTHEQKQLAPPWRYHVGRLWLDVPAAETKATAFAKTHGKIARIDAHGLEVEATPPRSATDHPAPLIAASKAFSKTKLALGKIVNSALHDRQQRKEILGKTTRA